MSYANINQFRWDSEVRAYELDIQGIVNNAVYLNYFDHTRVQHLLSRGVDWEQWHKRGFNIVLIHVDLALKHSLKAHEKFYVSSTMEKNGRLKIIFNQEIRNENETLIAKAINTVVCVSLKNGKPVMPEQLDQLLFF